MPKSGTRRKAKSEIARLVEDYERSKSDGRLSRFSEEETKKDFILPLFRALGWRVDSSEVSAEERILRGRADYGFKIGGVTKFYVEAKPLSKDIWERGSLAAGNRLQLCERRPVGCPDELRSDSGLVFGGERPEPIQ